MNRGLVRMIGLPLAMTIVMCGFVFAVNPQLYGVAVLAGGTVVTVGGLVAIRRLFGPFAADAVESDDNSSTHGDGENEP